MDMISRLFSWLAIGVSGIIVLTEANVYVMVNCKGGNAAAFEPFSMSKALV